MKPTALFAILVLVFQATLSPTTAEAQSSVGTSHLTTSAGYKKVGIRQPGLFRVGPLLGPGFAITDEKKDASAGDSLALFGGVMAGMGQGAFSFEVGAAYLKLSPILELRGEDGLDSFRYQLSTDYVGVPLWVKYNYIEKPLAVFFLKAGAIPMFLVGQGSKTAALNDASPAYELSLADSDVLGVLGFGGTAPLGERLAFVLDLNLFYGMNEVVAGTRHQGALLNIGLSYDL